MSDTATISQAEESLGLYLAQHRMRFTPERRELVRMVDRQEGHFTPAELMQQMEQEGHRVSLATVYNALSLMLKASVVKRHQFSSSQVTYEKVVRHSPGSGRFQLVCNFCGRIREIKDTHVARLLRRQDFGSFHPACYTLHVYGICNSCYRKQRKNKNQNV
ncbi:MAG: transcriptional repressor [Bacteroidales bacterium]|nr:transcriptional repressor [Bacteroidales bacterium]MCD8394445.1 transcriptional repressor [Bacteroidales bacterium]